MKNYYRILDLPENATSSQIKWQYKQLVRVYHPDRFKDLADKAYAENKLKDIIEAYQALSSREPNRNTYASVEREAPNDFEPHPPRPIVSHSFLDFGTLNRGQKETITIQVGNMGGVAQHLNFVLSDPSAWFTVSEQKQLYQDKLLPIEVDVTIDTRELELGKIYDGWIDVNLDNVTTRVNLAAQIAEKKRRFTFPLRMGILLGLLLLISSIAGFMATAMFSNSTSAIERNPIWTPDPVAATEVGSYITFSAHEGNSRAVFASQISGERQFKLNLVGMEPAWSPQHRQVAYIENDIHGNTQLFVAGIQNLAQVPQGEQTAGTPIVTSPTQITTSAEHKSRPVWSPTERRIGYITHPSADPINQTGSLVVVELDSQVESPLTEAKNGNVTDFSWSANGDSILVVLQKDQKTHLQVIDVATGMAEPLANEDAFIGVEVNGGAWLPDGSSAIISSAQGLYQLDVQREEMSQLSARPSLKPAISLENNKVAFLSPDENFEADVTNLWIIDSDGQNPTQITESGCIAFEWSSNGMYIAFITGNLQSDSPTLYLWVMKLGEEPKVIAEVNNPAITWLD